jgi:hypothetical protein
MACAVGLVSSLTSARTATTAERTECEAKIRPKIDRIESRLRAGYSLREGETLRAQLRKLEAQLLSCRKVE